MNKTIKLRVRKEIDRKSELNPAGAYIRGKIYEFRKNYHYNGSWRNRNKK